MGNQADKSPRSTPDLSRMAAQLNMKKQMARQDVSLERKVSSPKKEAKKMQILVFHDFFLNLFLKE